MAWRAYSVGPDEEIKVDPRDDGHGQADRHEQLDLKSWQGDQWKTGGGTTWGWYSYDPQLNLIYYGTGNPSTWNPCSGPATTSGR